MARQRKADKLFHEAWCAAEGDSKAKIAKTAVRNLSKHPPSLRFWENAASDEGPTAERLTTLLSEWNLTGITHTNTEISEGTETFHEDFEAL